MISLIYLFGSGKSDRFCRAHCAKRTSLIFRKIFRFPNEQATQIWRHRATRKESFFFLFLSSPCCVARATRRTRRNLAKIVVGFTAKTCFFYTLHQKYGHWPAVSLRKGVGNGRIESLREDLRQCRLFTGQGSPSLKPFLSFVLFLVNEGNSFRFNKGCRKSKTL